MMTVKTWTYKGKLIELVGDGPVKMYRACGRMFVSLREAKNFIKG